MSYRLHGIIADGSALGQNLVSEKDIEKLAALAVAHAKTNPKIRNALIMSSDESSQSLAAFYSFLAEEIDWDVELFHSEQEARDWLNH